MRHQHAGLAVPDLPLAYGQVWPDTDPESLSRYLARRVDIDALTAFQVRVHMLHRFNAVLTFLAVVFCCVRSRRLLPGHPLRAIAATWAVLLTAQFALGVFTVLTDKSADIATAHVAFGALCLATGTVSVWIVSTARAARGIGLAAVEPVLSAAAISLARRAAS
jgi:cytochrome c oxidase assembly protein subunit 15